jgi:hypothetical protein
VRLSEEDKYLWVRYDPTSDPRFGYSIDWTHEREWRAKVNRFYFLDWGLTPKEGVPLVLPPSFSEHRLPRPVVIVKTSEEATDLRRWFAALPAYQGGNGFVKKLYENRGNLHVVALESVTAAGVKKR